MPDRTKSAARSAEMVCAGAQAILLAMQGFLSVLRQLGLARAEVDHLKPRWRQIDMPLNLAILRADGGDAFSLFHERHVEVRQFQTHGLRIENYVSGVCLVITAIGE